MHKDANRLTYVNGITYTWDANSNLLSDGTSTYTYTHANRLAQDGWTSYQPYGETLSSSQGERRAMDSPGNGSTRIG